MIKFSSKGSFGDFEKFLKEDKKNKVLGIFEKYAQAGVDALRSATPIDSSLTAESWRYEIIAENGTYSIVWGNTNVVDGTPVAILLQYGHGTRNGGYVQGRDYINPALKPIFDRIATELGKVVNGK